MFMPAELTTVPPSVNIDVVIFIPIKIYRNVYLSLQRYNFFSTYAKNNS